MSWYGSLYGAYMALICRDMGDLEKGLISWKH